MRRDGGRLQVFREGGHFLGRHPTCPSDTQETILFRPRSISKLRVTKANLGSSTRLRLRQRVNFKCCGADAVTKAPPDYVLSAPNAPVPHNRSPLQFLARPPTKARLPQDLHLTCARLFFRIRNEARWRL